MLQQFLSNWKKRHKTPFNRILHAIGIPMTVLAIVPLCAGKWAWAALLFVAGYALQFLGHRQEKSVVGELLWIKNLFRK